MSSPPLLGNFEPPFSISSELGWQPTEKSQGSADVLDKCPLPPAIHHRDDGEDFYDADADTNEGNEYGPKFIRTHDRLQEFLRNDLCVERIHNITKYLWMVGLRRAARPLHKQLMIGRTVVITEQADLHLVWVESRIFIKPLPSYLLDRSFWVEHICKYEEIYRSACGFLRSYAWLVAYESDFQLASGQTGSSRLLPKSMKTWAQWVSFLEDFLSYVDPSLPLPRRIKVSPRYDYGELRLSRLNLIYRLAPQFRLRYLRSGYWNRYVNYEAFFSKKFAWAIAVFAYVSVILSAMQVGLGTEKLNQDVGFQRASYGFAVTSVIIPVILIVLVIIFYAALFLNNFVYAFKRISKRSK